MSTKPWGSSVNSIFSAAIEILTVLFVRETIFIHYLDKVLWWQPQLLIDYMPLSRVYHG